MNGLKYEESKAGSLVDVTGVYMWLSERTGAWGWRWVIVAVFI
jgi:hypothetical protein